MASQKRKYEVTSPEIGFFYHREITGYILVKLMKFNKPFNLCPEYKDAHPFDDIAFDYENEERTCQRLMQCKHKAELKLKDLLSTGKKKPFNMGKYYKSYSKIKEKNPDVDDLIMCTNAEWKDKNIFEEEDDHLLDWVKVPNYKEIFQDICRENSVENVREFFDKLKFWFTSDIGDMKSRTTSELETVLDGNVADEFYHMLKETVEERFKEFTAESITHENLADLRKETMRKNYSSLWFEFTDPVLDFHGMEGALSALRNAGNVAVVHGLEGAGKTELVRKFASERCFTHCIWINAESEYSIEKTFRDLAFQKLLFTPFDFAGNSKTIPSIVNEVCDFFETNALFIFDDAKDCIGILPLFQNHSVLITTRDENLPHDPKIELAGFTQIEARYYINQHLPDENNEDVIRLARHCRFLPKEIKDSVEQIKKKKKERRHLHLDYTISEYWASKRKEIL